MPQGYTSQEDDLNARILSIQGDCGQGINMPSRISYTTDPDMPEETTSYYRVEWKLEPSYELTGDWASYSLMEVTEENKEAYGVEETGWYYVLLTEFDFNLTFRWGELTGAQGIVNAVLDTLSMTVVYSGKVQNTFQLSDMSDENITINRDDGTDPDNPTSGSIKIKGLWKYRLDGTEITYWISDPAGEGEEKDRIDMDDLKLTNDQKEQLEAGDYFSIIYDNTEAPNFGAVTDRVHDNGSVYLTLSGETEYEATKKWLDGGDEEKRPTGTFQLWRYRDGASYTTAAPVRDENNGIVTIDLDGKRVTYDITGESLKNLPRYDNEGYRYVYVLREYLDSESAGNSYEQVLGEITQDGIIDKVWDPDKNEITDSGSREPGNTFLYHGGTISNRITDTVLVEADKQWNAMAFQSELEDVKIVLTLQSRPAGEGSDAWEPVVSEVTSEHVTRELSDFTAETMNNKSVSLSMPKYNNMGEELEYRWVETGVYQGESGKNLLSGGKFTLKQNGRNMEYTAVSSEPDSINVASSSYVNHITNTLENTIEYKVDKFWQNENGEEYKPEKGQQEAVQFSIYQILSGMGITSGMTPIVKITMDGEIDPDWTEASSELGIKWKEDSPWHVDIQGLPEFNGDGREYEYLLLEDRGTPAYTIKRDENNNYDTKVVNGAGGSAVMVRKQWVDDNDVQHRLPVKIQMYDEKGNPIGGSVTLGESGVWQQLVGIQNASPSQVSVRELSMVDGDTEYEVASDSNASQSGDSEPYNTVATGEHRYQVTYTGGQQLGATWFYTIINRRLGNINLTVTKDWKDGNGERRAALANALDKFNADEEVKLYPAIQLKFADADAQERGYKITCFMPEGDTVAIGGEQGERVAIYADPEKTTRGSSVQKLELRDGGLSNGQQTLYFYNLPKYDESGRTVHYEVEEVWVLEERGESKVVTLQEVQARDEYKENETLKTIIQLFSAYHTEYKQTYYTADRHDSDLQTIAVTNTLTGKKDVLWHKQWEDAYNNTSGLRPDLYLNIYRASTAPGNQTIETVVENYRWVNVELPDDVMEPQYDAERHWHAVLEDMDKYDAAGYEYIYYAVEHTIVRAEDFGYIPAIYSAPTDENGDILLPGDDGSLGTASTGDPKQIGTVEGPEQDTAEWMKNVTDLEDSDSAVWALAEDGTFTNRIRGTISITGRKIWSNLPAGYASADLPPVTFVLNRYVDKDTLNSGSADGEGRVWDLGPDKSKREVATLEITDWASLYANGSYAFTIQYEGKNIMKVDNGNVTFEPAGDDAEQLPRYDDQGRLYHYVLLEKEMGGEWSGNFQDGAVYEPSDSQNTGVYILNNRYKRDQDAHLTVKKFLYLPGSQPADGETFKPSNYPAVHFRLYRRFTHNNNGGPSDWEAVRSITWRASSVETTFNNAVKNGDEAAKKNGRLEWKYTFGDLAVYAPNGSEYEYMVAEVRDELQGYDTWMVRRDMSEDEVDKYIENPDNPPVTPSTDSGISNESMVTTGTKENETLSPATSSNASESEAATPSQATFINKDNTEDSVRIKGTKIWDDFNNAFGLRPASDSNADIGNALTTAGYTFTLQRSASSQTGQGNEIPLDDVTEDYTITWEKDANDKWNYTITGAALKRYAPNGMPWIYQVEETVEKGSDYRVVPYGGIAHQESATPSEGEVYEIRLSDLTNTLTVPNKGYRKKWQDEDGKPIQEDYLGYNLRVKFELQVAERGADGSIKLPWRKAGEYFKDVLTDEQYQAVFDGPYKEGDFTGAIPKDEKGASVTNPVWNNQQYFTKLPRRIIKKNEKTPTRLAYRVVETEIQYGTGDTLDGKVTIGVNEGSSDSYTYNFSENPIFFPAYESGDANTYTTTWHINRIKTTGFTVTKTWEGDSENAYGTRPATEGGEGWKTSFVIRRKTENSGWEDVTDSSGSPLIVEVIGTGESESKSVSGLPVTDAAGNTYSYRALELEPGFDPENIRDADCIETGEGYYENAYIASYSNAQTASASQVTNTLETTGIQAEKKWRGGQHENKTVTLELKYLSKEGQWTSFTPKAEVELDGIEDTDPENPYYYENSGWHAVWKGVPVVMPGSELKDGKTQYKVEETLPEGSILVDVSTPSNATVFTNAVTTSLTVKKYWSAPTDKRTKVTVALWRTIGEISPMNEDAEKVLDPEGAQGGNEQWTKIIAMPTGSGPGTAVFENLPKYDESGNLYRYYAREIQIGEEADAESGLGNTGTIENGTSTGTVRITEESDEYIIITDIPENSQGGTVNAATVIRNISKVDVSGTKTWKDNGNAYGTRPDIGENKIKLELSRTTDPPADPTADWEEVEVTEEQPKWSKSTENPDQWIYTYENLPYADDDGHRYVYKVVEVLPEIASSSTATASNAKYEPSYPSNPVDGDYLNIINTLTDTVDIPVEKIWKDGENRDGVRPASITLELMKKTESGGDETVGRVTLQPQDPNNSDAWKYVFEGRPKFDDEGKLIEYTVKETGQTGWMSQVEGAFEEDEDGTGRYTFTVTNTLGIVIPVRKIWGGVDGPLPESVTVGLYRIAEDAIGAAQEVTDSTGAPLTLVLNKSNQWNGSFGQNIFLPRFDENGKRWLYSVKELKIGDQPVHEADGYIVHETNTGTEKEPNWRISNIRPVQIVGTKTWLDDGNANKTRPTTLELELRRSTDSNAVPGMEESTDTWIPVTEQEMTAEGIQLIWENADTAHNVWTYIYTNLPATDDEKNPYTYLVTEKVPEGYELTAASPSNASPSNASPSYVKGGVDFTNLVSNKTMEVSGTKTWVDSGGRPGGVSLALYRKVNGGSPERVPGHAPEWKDTGTDVWTFTYKGLQEYDEQGRKYTYWVEESGVPDDYDVYYDADRLHLTNVRKGSITVSKTVTGSGGNREKEFTFTVTMLDTEIYGTMIKGSEINGTYGGMTFVDGIATFTLKHGQSLRADGLPGGMNYIVVELEAARDGYSTSETGAMGQIPAGGVAAADYTNYRGGSSGGGGGSNGGGGGGHRYVDTSGGGPGTGGGGSTAIVVGEQPRFDAPEVPLIRRGIAKTGDESKLLQYALLLFVSLAGLAALLFLGPLKKWRKKK